MTAIPPIEKTEMAKCSKCVRECVRLCARCGNSFCTKHLLSHSEKCSGYKTVIRSLLHDNLVEITKQVVEGMLRAI